MKKNIMCFSILMLNLMVLVSCGPKKPQVSPEEKGREVLTAVLEGTKTKYDFKYHENRTNNYKDDVSDVYQRVSVDLEKKVRVTLTTDSDGKYIEGDSGYGTFTGGAAYIYENADGVAKIVSYGEDLKWYEEDSFFYGFDDEAFMKVGGLLNTNDIAGLDSPVSADELFVPTNFVWVEDDGYFTFADSIAVSEGVNVTKEDAMTYFVYALTMYASYDGMCDVVGTELKLTPVYEENASYLSLSLKFDIRWIGDDANGDGQQDMSFMTYTGEIRNLTSDIVVPELGTERT